MNHPRIKSVSLLIDEIVIGETDEICEYNRPKLDIEIAWNTLFMSLSENYYREAV
ncbi:hypothetical protein [Desulfofarcimen acetoxidans]|uniref:hypothetical protein n=1 Tax=Desulfofarcimen acetoxidans TaxID=58138 RepID=UPI00019E647D|nr:hypothetical protein [Desulfofarcimen acetoxidans]